jgi:hypothetical protein
MTCRRQVVAAGSTIVAPSSVSSEMTSFWMGSTTGPTTSGL